MHAARAEPPPSRRPCPPAGSGTRWPRAGRSWPRRTAPRDRAAPRDQPPAPTPVGAVDPLPAQPQLVDDRRAGAAAAAAAEADHGHAARGREPQRARPAPSSQPGGRTVPAASVRRRRRHRRWGRARARRPRRPPAAPGVAPRRMPLLLLIHSRRRWSSSICTIQSVGRPWDTDGGDPAEAQPADARALGAEPQPALAVLVDVRHLGVGIARREPHRAAACPCARPRRRPWRRSTSYRSGPRASRACPPGTSCSTRLVATPGASAPPSVRSASHTAPSLARATIAASLSPGAGPRTASPCHPRTAERCCHRRPGTFRPGPRRCPSNPDRAVRRRRAGGAPAAGRGGGGVDGGHPRRSRSQPHGASGVALQPQRQVTGQAIARRQGEEGAILEAVQATAVGPDPQPALGVLGQALDSIGRSWTAAAPWAGTARRCRGPS